ncbi:MAG: rhlE-2 [Elusimicrobia bacterium]|nr:MAG: rhlE-2 [Elusimicrobiota bacterium]
MGFSPFQLHPKLSQGVREMGYVEPTPIQKQAIPHALAGKDVLGLAQTGTGKTAAFALPILQRLIPGVRGKLRALVVAPTRELAEQIHDAFRGLGAHTGLRSMTIYGGVGVGAQLAGLRSGVEIVVACPGRLLDHMGQGAVNLSAVEVLVLDEADRMFDMGFLPDIRKIVKRLPVQRQNLLFSATMPDDIRHLAHEILRHPETIQVDHDKALTTVTHALYPLPEGNKEGLLVAMLKGMDGGTVLVFTRTKRRAKKLDQRLKAEGFKAASLQGNLSQNRRKAALDGFRDGTHDVLVATDIAARGIDVSQISHVINYDMPDTVEAYTHRIGRTGRAAKTGDAFTFVTPADEDMVRRIEKHMNMRIERKTLAGFNYAARPAAAPSHPRHPQPQHQQQKKHHRGQGRGHGGPAGHGGHQRPAQRPSGAGSSHPPSQQQQPSQQQPARSPMSSRSHRPHRRHR